MVEGAPHTAKERSQGSTCVSLGCPPAPVYKGARGRPAGLERRAKGGGVLLPVGVGLPFPSPTRIGEGEGKERERERERGAAPPSLSNSASSWGGGRHLLAQPSLSPRGPLWPITSPGFPVTPSGTPVLSETTRNHSDVRTWLSNISICMSRPFRDSSSCP